MAKREKGYIFLQKQYYWNTSIRALLHTHTHLSRCDIRRQISILYLHKKTVFVVNYIALRLTRSYFLHSRTFLSLIFYIILPMKTTPLQSIDLWRMGGEEGVGYNNKIHLAVLKDHWDHFCSRRIFIFIYCFPSNTKIIYSTWYQPKSLQFGQSSQLGNELNIYEWRWPWVKIQLRPNLRQEVRRG